MSIYQIVMIIIWDIAKNANQLITRIKVGFVQNVTKAAVLVYRINIVSIVMMVITKIQRKWYIVIYVLRTLLQENLAVKHATKMM